MAVNMCYSLRKGKNDPEGDSEIIRLTASVSVARQPLLSRAVGTRFLPGRIAGV